MQDEKTGVPIRTVKSFMSRIPSVFTGEQQFKNTSIVKQNNEYFVNWSCNFHGLEWNRRAFEICMFIYYSRTSYGLHLSTTASFLQQPLFWWIFHTLTLV